MNAMDGNEFAHWIAYNSIFPIAEEQYLQAALICQVIGNRTGGNDGQPFKMTDYYLDFTSEKEDNYPTPEELLIKAKQINSMIVAINQTKASQQIKEQ